jgi:V/A-type H+-transporting ATPase subunit I
MALDPVVKVEITAHTAVMDKVLDDLQPLSVIQIDPHVVKEWENEKTALRDTTERISFLKTEILEVERATGFLQRFEPPVPLLKKLSIEPDTIAKSGLKKVVEEKGAQSIKEEALKTEREIEERENKTKELLQKIDELVPLQDFQAPLNLLHSQGQFRVLISKLDGEAFHNLVRSDVSELLHMEKISGEETVYFSIVYHTSVEGAVHQLEKDFHFEPLSLPETSYPDSPKRISEIINEWEEKIRVLEQENEQFCLQSAEIAKQTVVLRYYFDYLQSELEKESAKERFFFTQKTCVINGWLGERDYPLLEEVIVRHKEASVEKIKKEEEEAPPVIYKNNRIVSPFELIVNLYSPPNPKEVDPTPILMPFYTIFFGLCLTDAGYGLVVALMTLLGIVILKPRNGVRKFLTLFFILGAATFVIGALIGTVFGIDFNALPESLLWLKEARYKIMIFDSSKDVLTFFGLALALGVLHLIAGYVIKIFMLIKSGDWAEAVCDHLPWIFLLLSPVPMLLSKPFPQHQDLLKTLFFVLIGLWGGILLFFSERSSWNPLKRIGKGIFTIYGATGVLADVLSYSRLLALGLATGVIASVMNTLAGMIKQLPIIGIVGFVGVLIIGHLFNLFISGLSAFVHSIRLQFMEFFTKFYTGEGELLSVFAEKRKYTYVPPKK